MKISYWYEDSSSDLWQNKKIVGNWELWIYMMEWSIKKLRINLLNTMQVYFSSSTMVDWELPFTICPWIVVEIKIYRIFKLRGRSIEIHLLNSHTAWVCIRVQKNCQWNGHFSNDLGWFLDQKKGVTKIFYCIFSKYRDFSNL